MTTKINDLMAISWIVLGVFILIIALREQGVVKWLGVTGSSFLILLELNYLFEFFKRK